MPESRIQVSNISLVNPIVNSIKRLPVYKSHLSKQMKSLIQLLLGTTLLMANFSFAGLMFPSSLLTRTGSSTSQPLEVLAVKDQQGSADNSNSYIEFDTNQRDIQEPSNSTCRPHQTQRFSN